MSDTKTTPDRAPRRPYTQPELRVHGTAAELTRATKPLGSGDALFSGNSVVAGG